MKRKRFMAFAFISLIVLSFSGCTITDNSLPEIYFETNGGEAVSSISQEINSILIEPDNPIKEGHTFEGWYLDSSLNNTYTFATMPAESIILYAKWTVNSYKISFIDDNIIIKTVDRLYGTSLSDIEYPEYSIKPDFQFIGWSNSLPNFMPSNDLNITANYLKYLSVDNHIIINGISNINITEMIIPSSINDKPVKAIANYAFAGANNLRSIVIPNGVTSIGVYALSGASSLTSIVIPDSVTSIGAYAFAGTSSLTSIVIPNGVTSIGASAFWGASSLTSIVIPNSVTSIADSAFSGASSLTSINVESGNSHFSSVDGVLYNKTQTTLIRYPEGITAVTFSIPNSVTSIEGFAFEGSSSLRSIVIPNSVTNIGYLAFEGVSNLRSINVESGNSHFSSVDGVLYNDTQSTLIKYPEGKSAITYTIPSSVTSVLQYAFSGARSLISIVIPHSVSYIDPWAFYGATGLIIINVESGNSNYSSVDGVLYNKTQTTIIKYPNGNSAVNFTIPDSVTSIGDYAFYQAINLTNIMIPNSVTSIGNYAFFGASNLSSIEIPNSVTSIGYFAFSRASSLTSIVIPNSVINIGFSAFKETGNLTIYAEATSKPSEWISSWNPDNRPIVWGYTGE
jgi:uncharacterized repeat protein (TIGR02543 family)